MNGLEKERRRLEALIKQNGDDLSKEVKEKLKIIRLQLSLLSHIEDQLEDTSSHDEL